MRQDAESWQGMIWHLLILAEGRCQSIPSRILRPVSPPPSVNGNVAHATNMTRDAANQRKPVTAGPEDPHTKGKNYIPPNLVHLLCDVGSPCSLASIQDSTVGRVGYAGAMADRM